MNSETIVLSVKSSKSATFSSWVDTLTNYFQSKGFTIANNTGFGIINSTCGVTVKDPGGVVADGEMLFGIEVTDGIGIAILTTDWNEIISRFWFCFYTIVDDTINIVRLHNNTDNVYVTSAYASSYHISINYNFDNYNKYFDVKLDEASAAANIFAGFLITTFNDAEISSTLNKCLICMSSSGYNSLVVSPLKVFNTVTGIQLKPSLTLSLPSSRYACYSSEIILSDAYTLYGTFPNLVGICGDFTHAYAQEISVDGKNYFHLGNHIYMPL